MLVNIDVLGTVSVVRLVACLFLENVLHPWSDAVSVHSLPSENAETSDVLEDSAGAIRKRAQGEHLGPARRLTCWMLVVAHAGSKLLQ
jgi:hypothetical protein